MNLLILKKHALSVIVIIVIICYYFLFWHPNMEDIQNTKKSIAAKEEQWHKVQLDLKMWPRTATREKMAEYKEKLQLLLNLIPTQEQIPTFLDQLQRDGIEKSHLNIINFSALPKKEAAEKPKSPPGSAQNQTQEGEEAKKTEKPKYDRATYKLIANGSFINLLSFLNDLESGNRLVSIDELKLNSSSVDPKKPGVDVETDLSVFYTTDELKLALGH